MQKLKNDLFSCELADPSVHDSITPVSSYGESNEYDKYAILKEEEEKKKKNNQ